MVRLEEITIIRAPVERCFDLARSVEAHLAGNIHCGGMPMLGRLAEVTFLGSYMKALLEEGNTVLRNLAESDGWRGYLA